MKKSILIKSAEEIIEVGRKIGKRAFPNMLITMNGSLGAGKTTMTKGIGEALGVKRVINSPTFTIMKIYEGRLPLYHMDVYRIDNNSGDDYLEEYFEMNGVVVIEWANNIDSLLKEERLNIDIVINDDNTRTLILESNDKEYEEIINAI